MFAFPSMLTRAAEQAGMKAPSDEDADSDNFNKEDYPHFWVFCLLQLNRPMQPGEHWDNAKVIAEIPEDKLKSMTPVDFVQAGVTGLSF